MKSIQYAWNLAKSVMFAENTTKALATKLYMATKTASITENIFSTTDHTLRTVAIEDLDVVSVNSSEKWGGTSGAVITVPIITANGQTFGSGARGFGMFGTSSPFTAVARKNMFVRYFSTSTTRNDDIPSILVGSNSFKKLVLNSAVIVDKTPFLEDFFLGSNEVCLFTYPRRWGKSVNLDMVKRFCGIEVDENGMPLPVEERENRKLFTGGEIDLGGSAGVKQLQPLKIAANERIMLDQGEFPVISIDLKRVSGASYEKALSGLKIALHSAFLEHEYLLKSPKLREDDLETFSDYVHRKNHQNLAEHQVEIGIETLCQLLYAHFGKKSVILVDEYDSAINKAYIDPDAEEGDLHRIVTLHTEILSNAFKGNDNLTRGLITGVFRIAKANIFSGLNNLSEFGLGDRKFALYYGFTQVEVDNLLEIYGVPRELAERIKAWYNGYNVLGTEIYNPWSVINVLDAYQNCRHVLDSDEIKAEILRSYWGESGNVNFITPLLKHPGVGDRTKDLSVGNPIHFDQKRALSVEDYSELRQMVSLGSNYKINESGVDILFSYLLAAGYLTPNGKKDYFRVPNKEVQAVFKDKLLKHYKAQYNINTQLFYNITDQLQLVLDAKGDDEYGTAVNGIEVALKQLVDSMPEFVKIDRHDITSTSGGRFVHGNEDLVHSALNYTALQLCNITQVGTEVHLGKGRADLIIIDERNSKAIIMEIKYNQKSASGAVQQIKDTEYGTPIPKDYDRVLLGINVNQDKIVDVEYELQKKFIC